MAFMNVRVRRNLLLCLLLGFISLHDSHAKTRLLTTSQIDESSFVSLPGSTRPEARDPRFDRGAVPDSTPVEHMLLVLKRPAQIEAALLQFIDALQNPSSSQYHKWLTPSAFDERFGLAASDVATVTEWLKIHGFTVNAIRSGGSIIDFSGQAGQVTETFRTELHALDVEGEQHIANVADPQIPASLTPAIIGLVSLNDFRPHALHRDIASSHFEPDTGNILANDTVTLGNATYEAVTPGDLATIYNITPLFNAGLAGQGQTIAVIEDSNLYSTADWTSFRSAFGLARFTTGNLVQVHPGNCVNPGVTGDDGEATLDAEYATSSAPGATIEVASCADSRTTFGGLLALENLITSSKTPPAVISYSYGICESLNGATANAAYSQLYQQAVTEGVSIFVSAGDSGGAVCDAGASIATHGSGINAFAATAYNVAVGGTDFGDTYTHTNSSYWNPTNSSISASAKSYINEIPWNDSCASSLISAAATGSNLPYGASGFCNTTLGREDFLNTEAASGGASACFTGSASASGVVSGTCHGNPKPSWQSKVVGLPSDGVRDIPDLSLFAANGVWGHYYIYCFSDKAHGGSSCAGAPSTWSGAGGTSFAAPVMAGLQALVDQRTAQRQGNPNPEYYKLAAAEYGLSGSAACNSSKGKSVSSSCVFYDITQGDTDVDCDGTTGCYRPSGTYGVLSTSNSAYKPASPAGTGYDLATGLGSINAYNLVTSWPSSAGLRASTASPFRPTRSVPFLPDRPGLGIF